MLLLSAHALSCGKVHHDAQARPPPVQGAGRGGASGASSSSTAAGRGGAGGAPQAALCELSAEQLCGEFEAGAPRVFLLTPRQYQNSVRTLFGVDVDVEELLPGPYEAIVSELPPELANDTLTNYHEAAAIAAAQITTAAPSLLTCADDACIAALVGTLAPRVWRSFVAPGHQNELVDVARAQSGSLVDKQRALLRRLLASPRFYSRTELGDSAQNFPRRLSADELASKLSYLFWVDTPDDSLLEAAADGSLTESDVLVQQAERLLEDPRAAAALPAFYERWLGLGRLDTALDKDASLFPEWTAALALDMKRETTEFLNDAVLGSDPSLRNLLQAEHSFASPELAAFYGAAHPGGGFARIELPAERRGLLTQASLLVLRSSLRLTSPTQRAMLVRDRLRCEYVPYVGDGHLFNQFEVDETLSARQRSFWLQDKFCAQCHQLLEPVGFAFENFDPIGRHRTEDAGAPIDASGQLLKFNGELIYDFADVPSLGQKMAQDPRVLACFAQQALAWSGTLRGSCSALGVAQQNCQGANLRQTLAGIAGTEAFSLVHTGRDFAFLTSDPSCPAAGASDCDVLAQHSQVERGTCEACQGAPCGTSGCEEFGCREGVTVLRVCCKDEDCEGIDAMCGLHASTHFVCVKSDPI